MSQESDPLGWLREVRNLELSRIVEFLPAGGRVLDFGAGPGHQALRLKELGFQVSAVDVNSCAHTVFPVATYDGRTLPYPDGYFDAVISSNVLEHVTGLPAVLAEATRVLKLGGVGLHVMPSSTWRLWTTLAEFVGAPRNVLRALRTEPHGRWAHLSSRQWVLAWMLRPVLFRPHGEQGSALTELWSFSRHVWTRRLAACGSTVERVVPLRFCYSGEILFGARLSVARRVRLAAWLGSSTILYVTRPAAKRSPP